MCKIRDNFVVFNDRHNDEHKGIQAWNTLHVQQAIQEAWSHPPVYLYGQLQKRRYRRCQGKTLYISYQVNIYHWRHKGYFNKHR